MFEITMKLTEKMMFDRERCNEDSDCSDCSCWMANGECLFNFTEKHKVGKWIKSDIGGAKVCSICQAHMGLSNFKFCPTCGAEMRVGE